MFVCPFLPSFICYYNVFCDSVSGTKYVGSSVTIFKEIEASRVSISQTAPVYLLWHWKYNMINSCVVSVQCALVPHLLVSWENNSFLSDPNGSKMLYLFKCEKLNLWRKT